MSQLAACRRRRKEEEEQAAEQSLKLVTVYEVSDVAILLMFAFMCNICDGLIIIIGSMMLGMLKLGASTWLRICIYNG